MDLSCKITTGVRATDKQTFLVTLMLQKTCLALANLLFPISDRNS